MTTNGDLRPRLLLALQQEREWSDIASDSPLDLLTYEIRSSEELSEAIFEVLPSIIRDCLSSNQEFAALEKLIVDLAPPDRSISEECLELLSAGNIPAPANRLVALNIMHFFDRAVPARYLNDDHALKAIAPLQWLDLALPSMMDLKSRREAILALIEQRSFPVSAMWARADAIWRAGGREPARWFETVMAALPLAEQSEFRELVTEAFGSSPQRDTRPSKVRLMRGAHRHSVATMRTYGEAVARHVRRANSSRQVTEIA